MATHIDDPDSDDTDFWRRILERLREGGANRAEALDGANLVLSALQRWRRMPDDDMRAAAPDSEVGE